MIKFVTSIMAVLFSASAFATDPIVTESTSNTTVTSNGSMETTVKSPPPSAISHNSVQEPTAISAPLALQEQCKHRF